MNYKQQIGLFGYGTVGAGLVYALDKGKTVHAEIKKICIKNGEKSRDLDASFFTTDRNVLLQDPEINLIVELIDDADAAYEIVKTALQNGKSVVSGNKKMLAHHLPEMIELQREHNCALLYDASACGSIPVIRNLEEYYDNDLLTSLTGILNGSSNYILSQMFTWGSSYSSALKEAQEKGFAESNPSLDVDGFDSLYKLIVLTLHSMGTYIVPSQVFHSGISKISVADVQYAREKGKKIKLVGYISKLNENEFTVFVVPRFVTTDNYIYNVENEFNGVVIEGECYDKQFMFGRGAGANPTGSAVLSDITARMHHYRYEYKKMKYFRPMSYSKNVLLEIYLRYENLVDLSFFEFERISEKYSGPEYNYVIGTISLENLLKINKLILKHEMFVCWTGSMHAL